MIAYGWRPQEGTPVEPGVVDKVAKEAKRQMKEQKKRARELAKVSAHSPSSSNDNGIV